MSGGSQRGPGGEDAVLQLVIFDLEWNIGYKPRMFDYHGVEQTLRGEIIQIGAVKVDPAGRVQDRFTITLKPRIFRKLQHHIAKVTGMTQQQLDSGVPIREGLQRFLDWCGPDTALAEWGLDDVPVLKQNLFINHIDENWPCQWYDLQQVFLAQHPRQEGEGMTLESVVERMGLPRERPFHDALADAEYTAEVCQCIDLEAGLAAYPTEDQQMLDALTGDEGDYRDFAVFGPELDRESWRQHPQAQDSRCPECGAVLQKDGDDVWLKRGNTGYYSLQTCPLHGAWLVRYKLIRRDGLHWRIGRIYEKPTPAQLDKWKKQRAQTLARMRRAAEKAARERVEAAGK